jgi:DNA-binding Xre family transcriptional regulator
MAIHWRLKTYLATSHGIYHATALQKRIVKKTGFLISTPNLRSYMNRKPKSIRLKTLELIVTALECELSHFLEIKPAEISVGETKKLSYQNTPLSKRAVDQFPDPKNYK